MKKYLVPFAALIALSFTSCQMEEEYAGYSGKLMDSSWAWVTSYSEGECPNEESHYTGEAGSGTDSTSSVVVVTTDDVKVEESTEDYNGIYLDFFMDDNVPAANIGTFAGKKTTAAYTYEETTYSDGSKSNNKAEKLAKASVSYSDLVFTHVDKAIISEVGLETPPFNFVFSSDEGEKLASQTCLADANGGGYKLTYTEDDDELSLLYKEETLTCSASTDKQGTKCGTQYEKKYYGLWTEIDHDDAM